ncbi:hypothetical protein CRG98_046723 [Punica granatum]|uniref:Uncharacterized protein n=1 Tax=Punica granatum TaxID=22663 RepID=A0A2I0HMJ9_PUNGR|nr:hypothetical protein CRG98_046723 [Punica granatum]
MGRTGLLGRTGLMDRTGLDWAGLAGLGRWAVGHGTRLGRDRLDWWKTSEGGARWFERFGRLLQAGWFKRRGSAACDLLASPRAREGGRLGRESSGQHIGEWRELAIGGCRARTGREMGVFWNREGAERVVGVMLPKMEASHRDAMRRREMAEREGAVGQREKLQAFIFAWRGEKLGLHTVKQARA